ncbi:MAG: ExeA family protein [Gammaproteobacteria bacterium]
MYCDYYELKDNPFNVTADPDFFFSSKYHTEAMHQLLFGIEQRKGIMVITGEIGTGKTTLCRKLLQQANKKTRFALLLNPNFSELELLQLILRDFGIRTREQNKIALFNKLNHFLLKESKKGYNVVIVIDEAQNLGTDQLEQIRLLSNLETAKHKLLQVILMGQPELDHKLRLPELRQLRQRIAVYYHIFPLERKDIRNYIYHRLSKVMKNHNSMRNVFFTEEAIDALFFHSQGTPRMINLFCDRALLAGYAADTFSINKNIIDNCAKEILYCEHNL